MTKPRIISKSEIPVAYIEMKVTLREWGKANALFPKIFEWVDRNGGQVAGPPFYQYLTIGDFDKEFHLRAGIITKELMIGDELVETTKLSSGTYLSLIHDGHPDHLEKSHKFIQAWAKDKQLTFPKTVNERGDFWDGLFEFYLTKPDEEPDLNQWKTEILYLIK